MNVYIITPVYTLLQQLKLVTLLQENSVTKQPHLFYLQFLLHYLKSVYDWLDPVVKQKVPIATTAWAILRDSYHGNVCLEYSPEHIAVAVLYFALQCHGVEVPYSDTAEYEWWQVCVIFTLLLTLFFILLFTLLYTVVYTIYTVVYTLLYIVVYIIYPHLHSSLHCCLHSSLHCLPTWDNEAPSYNYIVF